MDLSTLGFIQLFSLRFYCLKDVLKFIQKDRSGQSEWDSEGGNQIACIDKSKRTKTLGHNPEIQRGSLEVWWSKDSDLKGPEWLNKSL